VSGASAPINPAGKVLGFRKREKCRSRTNKNVIHEVEGVGGPPPRRYDVGNPRGRSITKEEPAAGEGIRNFEVDGTNANVKARPPQGMRRELRGNVQRRQCVKTDRLQKGEDWRLRRRKGRVRVSGMRSEKECTRVGGRKRGRAREARIRIEKTTGAKHSHQTSEKVRTSSEESWAVVEARTHQEEKSLAAAARKGPGSVRKTGRSRFQGDLSSVMPKNRPMQAGTGSRTIQKPREEGHSESRGKGASHDPELTVWPPECRQY